MCLLFLLKNKLHSWKITRTLENRYYTLIGSPKNNLLINSFSLSNLKKMSANNNLNTNHNVTQVTNLTKNEESNNNNDLIKGNEQE